LVSQALWPATDTNYHHHDDKIEHEEKIDASTIEGIQDVGINFSPPQSNMRENAHVNDTARGLASPMNTLGITIFCNKTHS
jgi:hypothetical protein